MLRDQKFENMGPAYLPDGQSLSSARDEFTQRRADSSVFLSGISANSPILAMRGTVSARDLRVGDMVMTRNNGYQALRWLGSSRRARAHDKPIRLPHIDGEDAAPLVSEYHLVLLEYAEFETRFGSREVLCEAGNIAHYDKRYVPVSTIPTYIHMLFDTYELVRSGGYWIETLQPDVLKLRKLEPELAEEMAQAVPKLSNVQGMAAYVHDRPVLDRRETGEIFK